MFGRGWLSNLYARYVSEAMSDLKHQLGMPPDARDPDPDHDIAEPSPRAFFREQLANGERGAAWRVEVLEQVRRELRRLPPEELSPTS